jgi:hypothetical protein
MFKASRESELNVAAIAIARVGALVLARSARRS